MAGLVIASLGGGELALREHMGGYRSHSSLLAGVAAFVVGERRGARPRPGEGLGPPRARCRRLRRYVLRDARAIQAPLRRPRLPMNERRMRIAGLHHITLLVRRRGALAGLLPQPARHAAGEADRERGRPAARGTSSSATRRDGPARSSPASSTPISTRARSAAARPTTSRSRSRARRSSAAWRDYLISRGIPATEVMDRTYFKSIYLRDPDGHIVEIADRRPLVDGGAARAAGLSPAALALAPVRRPSVRARAPRQRACTSTEDPAGAFFAVSTAASARRCRSVSVPTCLFSGTPERDQQPPAAGPAPALLAHQQVADRHAVSLPGAAEDHLSWPGARPRRFDASSEPGRGVRGSRTPAPADAALAQRRSWPTCPSDLPALSAISRKRKRRCRYPGASERRMHVSGWARHALPLLEAGAHQNPSQAERQHRLRAPGR